MDTSELSESQIQVKFVTKQEHYAIPDVPYSVPTNIDTKNLNVLVNQVLKETNPDILKKISFDFLISGELLRQQLLEHLAERNLSSESTVEIEYIDRTPAPEPQDALLHDDWVAGIQVNDKWILTGCYDNTVNIWSTKGKHVSAASVHTNYIRAVSWLKKDDPSSGFATVSHDLSGILWHWEPGTTEPTPSVILKGHERGIDTVSVSPNGKRLVTGGWDTNLKIWSAALEADHDEPPSKRSRGTITRTPLNTLKGHKETISCSEWIDNYTVATCSMDHTIKLWDAELCGIKSEIIGQKSYLSLSYSTLNNLLITSSADRHIRLYDPRSSDGSVCKNTYTSHSLWVSSVKWSTKSEYLFLSGSYDSSVKLWDTRSNKASLYDLSGHEGKVLCVDWSNDSFMVSGGSDNNVHIYKNKCDY